MVEQKPTSADLEKTKNMIIAVSQQISDVCRFVQLGVMRGALIHLLSQVLLTEVNMDPGRAKQAVNHVADLLRANIDELVKGSRH